jgi:hypothetical protein
MGAHLRNGKDLSFKHQAAAAATARNQRRAEQQRRKQHQTSQRSVPTAEATTSSAGGTHQGANQGAPQLPQTKGEHPPSDRIARSSQLASIKRTLPQSAYSQSSNPSQSNKAQMGTRHKADHRILPALPRLSAFAKLESSLPPLMGFEELDLLTEANLPYDPPRGVTPSEVNSQAASTALASTQSTPVPRPIEQQEFLVTRQELPLPPPPRSKESNTPIQNQLVLREMTEAPHDIVHYPP